LCGPVAPGLDWLGMGNPGNDCDNYFRKVRNLVQGSLFWEPRKTKESVILRVLPDRAFWH
jgi:hypothetical protein